ncbi:cytochrome b-c1 complex subunit 6, mitochondrial-like [Ptychodera flava]|uniref:cytochrome b-c1 complex subunit 6, mitochondrial-like n=1 Tax=Ptychodera flava TaxID=63121 RepID=UPI003969FA8E
MALGDEREYESDPPEEEEEEEEEDEDEEDIPDPVEDIREKCSELSACAKLKNEFDICNERVSSRSKTEETCTQELFDFLHCQDACVSKQILSKLK